MYQPVSSTIHCINPKCPKPAGQPWGNKFCQGCGAPLELNQRYIPLYSIGTGGFSALYTVWDLQAQTEKVLKVLLEPSAKALELFSQEAFVLAKLRHPGIPKVEADGYFFLRKRNAAVSPLPCLVMEKIHGPTLEQILDYYPQGCPEVWLMNWLNQALDILRELHRHQIIHRDLKPSNLMLRSPLSFPVDAHQIQHNQLVMIDFGGAKQLKNPDQASTLTSRTTRLVSPGYSPPEQIVGAWVNPATDFYSLGRSCIHLLTGVFPGELEDPELAGLKWRDRTAITPRFANLLDQMVLSDNALRPQTTLEIQTALFQIVRQHKYPWRGLSPGELAFYGIKTILIQLDWGLTILSEFLGKLLLSLLTAILETAWEMGLAGMGGVLGTALGLILVYFTTLDESLAQVLNQLLTQQLAQSSLNDLEFSRYLGSGILVSGLAGFGTAMGLTDAGGFNQDRHYGWAGFLGGLGYGVGSAIAQITAIAGQPLETYVDIALFNPSRYLSLAMAAALMTLGLGLPSHQIVYILSSSLGVAAIFWGLGLDNSFPEIVLQFPMLNFVLDWETFWLSLAFSGILGCSIGLCLGISHYLIIPVLRWLGWR
ncbi:MAG: serine/threonine protein kinase [Oscillatoriales cyanobacterium SM2_3_0]|nr:serine/threonine protein kinase [Oscillatoriales cyanobacterium SM2_3_0]